LPHDQHVGSAEEDSPRCLAQFTSNQQEDEAMKRAKIEEGVTSVDAVRASLALLRDTPAMAESALLHALELPREEAQQRAAILRGYLQVSGVLV
jgi:hypothetical protein